MKIIVEEPYKGHVYARDDDRYDVDMVDGGYVASYQGSGCTPLDAVLDLMECYQGRVSVTVALNGEHVFTDGWEVGQ